MENKYKQIVAHIKDMIKIGELTSGSKTPSIQNICTQFSCNKSTAIRAYDELQKEHILYSVPKSGFYVVERDVVKSNNDDALIDFSSASPNTKLLPYQEFQHCINQATRIYKDSLFSYSDVQGSLELRKTLKNHFREYYMFTKTKNIVITSGSQQALYILSKIPFPNGKHNVLIEQPTYYGMMAALGYNDITTIGINRYVNGFDFDELERIFKSEDIKFFYIIPRFHNPTGFSLNNKQKKQIINLAEKYNVYIVEDDYLADLELHSKNETMYSMDTSNRVVYIKSFSKTLLPGIRMCALALPQVIVETFIKHKVCCDFITNPLSQGALEIYLKSGMYEKHLKYIKKFYSEQMDILKDAVTLELLLSTTSFIPKIGFFACIELPSSVRAQNVENALKERKVHVLNIEKMFLPKYERNNLLRISICRVNKQQIFKGIKLISEVIKSKNNY